jgi:hypothetical protein
VLGAHHAITVPYNADFKRSRAHRSWLYFGASLRALAELARAKGYVLVGCGSHGINAFFVRQDCASRLQAVSVGDAFRMSRHRDSRDERGNFNHIGGAERLEAISSCFVYDIHGDRLIRIKDLDHA